MPFVNIKVAAAQLTAEQIRRLQEDATDLMANVLSKSPELTAVLVEQVTKEGWSVGRKAVGIAAHLDAKVTAGTNTPEQKALFVAKANRLIHEVLGNDLPLATYVVIDEIPGNAWGYDGLTQDHRRDAKARVEA